MSVQHAAAISIFASTASFTILMRTVNAASRFMSLSRKRRKQIFVTFFEPAKGGLQK
jgi:hypothetical protein